MGYCPNCRSEYRPEMSQCAECGAELVDTLPEAQSLQAIYRAGDGLTANRVSVVILDGFEAQVLGRAGRTATEGAKEGDSSLLGPAYNPFPTPAVGGGRETVLVPADKAAAAREALRQALEDGALAADDGEILEPEG